MLFCFKHWLQPLSARVKEACVSAEHSHLYANRLPMPIPSFLRLLLFRLVWWTGRTVRSEINRLTLRILQRPPRRLVWITREIPKAPASSGKPVRDAGSRRGRRPKTGTPAAQAHQFTVGTRRLRHGIASFSLRHQLARPAAPSAWARRPYRQHRRRLARGGRWRGLDWGLWWRPEEEDAGTLWLSGALCGWGGTLCACEQKHPRQRNPVPIPSWGRDRFMCSLISTFPAALRPFSSGGSSLALCHRPLLLPAVARTYWCAHVTTRVPRRPPVTCLLLLVRAEH
jgi:hypothetical protein